MLDLVLEAFAEVLVSAKGLPVPIVAILGITVIAASSALVDGLTHSKD
jgi:hypothetical protein